jgi:hypothetical protein
MTCNSYQEVSEISRGIWIRYNRDVDPSHVGIHGHGRADVLAKEGSISGTLFQDQAGLATVKTYHIHTRARTKLLTEWQ